MGDLYKLYHSGGADYYSFHAFSGFKLDAQITIPYIASLQDFPPHLALIGTGLPAQEDTASGLIIAPGDCVQIFNAAHTGTSNPFYEPFTQTTYWPRQTVSLTLWTSGILLDGVQRVFT
jgi:hypothetical protein